MFVWLSTIPNVIVSVSSGVHMLFYFSFVVNGLYFPLATCFGLLGSFGVHLRLVLHEFIYYLFNRSAFVQTMFFQKYAHVRQCVFKK